MRLRSFLFTLLLAVSALRADASDPWTAPTPAELAMTSIPQVPGAAAVYLYREQKTDDFNHVTTYYERIKVLTDKGKEYANVVLSFGANEGSKYNNIQGRTIHANGTIVPFAGKPYEKVVENYNGFKLKAKVFSLPDVEVGSILEIRYEYHYDYYLTPVWLVQSGLYTSRVHFEWKPTQDAVSTGYGVVSRGVQWTPILPAGAAVQTAKKGSQSIITLDMDNIAPFQREPNMPPLDSVTYRVLFYYSAYATADLYWKDYGNRWTAALNLFIGPGKLVKAAVDGMAPAEGQSGTRLRTLYKAVQAMENTDFTRERTRREDQAVGLREAQNTDDLWTRKRGSGDELAQLFVAMARAAGFKAYVALVTDRSKGIFMPGYLSFRQMQDYIAIVELDGKEMYFDPGQAACPFGQIVWTHNLTGGIRQTAEGSALVRISASPYTQNHINRTANLNVDPDGVADGTVTFNWTGNPAILWRQRARLGDRISLEAALKRAAEGRLPTGVDVKVSGIENLEDYEQPLQVSFAIHGNIAAVTGKRLLLPAYLFRANDEPSFTTVRREQPVDVEYAEIDQDAVRYVLPASLTVESVPPPAKAAIEKVANFTTESKQAGPNITQYYNFVMGRAVIQPQEYPALRAFYSTVNAANKELLILSKPAK